MKRLPVFASGLALLAIASGAAAQAASAAPPMPKVCANCHKAVPGEIRGIFENVAFKSKSIQLKIDAHTEIVKFDAKTLKVVDVEKKGPGEMMREIAKGREARIEYETESGVKVARLISFKGPIEIDPAKTVNYEFVEQLVVQGPERGGYTLIDSRPLPRVQEGTIPTSINVPYPAFDKFVDRLPKDKRSLTVFFCQGVTCMMSPKSLLRAEALGYTNAKVYREGYPEWAERNVGVVAAPHLKQAWIDKQIPHVLVDARPASTAEGAFIPGAVSIPPSKVREAVKTLPDPKLKAPIMVYDGDDGTAAKLVAKVIHDSGQVNVTTIGGGFDAYKAAGYPVAAGVPATQVAYAPRPRPGEISIEEFRRIVASTPPDTLILDVRNTDEANAGMIKGAMLVPDEEILARMSEIPKDKHIVTHCSTGIRAEMAYHKLKQAGYNVNFVRADIDVDKKGNVKISTPS